MTDPAIPAATLIVWRDRAGGPSGDILVVQRSAKMAFAAGAIVFPGGRVDEADIALASALGRPDDAAKITAIRETLEESAVAPALSGALSADQGRAMQQELIEGREFADLLAGHGLSLDLDALTPFARWMPAFKQPRRFDTHFFVTPAPAGEWLPHPQEGECVAAEWASPLDLIDRIERGTAGAIFPTKRNLERLARHTTFAELRADAEAHSLETIVPWVEEHDGEPHVTIPQGRGYPVTREPLATAFRA